MAFYILITLAIVSAAAILVVRSVLDAALCLIVCLLALAGVYIVLSAEFLAIVQILVYAGGILLLIIFGVMITRDHLRQGRSRQLAAFPAGVAMTTILWMGIQDISVSSSQANVVTASQLGTSLMTGYALPFEVGGVLLLVSLIGAMITSSVRNRS